MEQSHADVSLLFLANAVASLAHYCHSTPDSLVLCLFGSKKCNAIEWPIFKIPKIKIYLYNTFTKLDLLFKVMYRLEQWKIFWQRKKMRKKSCIKRSREKFTLRQVFTTYCETVSIKVLQHFRKDDTPQLWLIKNNVLCVNLAFWQEIAVCFVIISSNVSWTLLGFLFFLH